MKNIQVADGSVGEGQRPFVIAEVGQAHDGSLGMAHAYIDAIAEAGADAVKFQTHIADEESTVDEPFRVKFSRQDKTRYDYWRRMEFEPEQWHGLAEHAQDAGLIFLSSPFSVAAVHLLEGVGVPAWKIGSGEVGSFDILEAIAETGKPVLLSSGMSTYEEIGKTVAYLRNARIPLALFQCTSRYPVGYDEVGLNVLDEFRDRFECPVGLSDHSGTIYPAMAAMALNADLVELHVVFDKKMFGVDAPASVDFEELKLVTRAAHAFHEMRENPIDKDAKAGEMESMRRIFNKSVSVNRNLASGTVLQQDMLVLKKPATGIPATEKDKLVGRKLVRNVQADRLLKWEDVE